MDENIRCSVKGNIRSIDPTSMIAMTLALTAGMGYIGAPLVKQCLFSITDDYRLIVTVAEKNKTVNETFSLYDIIKCKMDVSKGGVHVITLIFDIIGNKRKLVFEFVESDYDISKKINVVRFISILKCWNSLPEIDTSETENDAIELIAIGYKRGVAGGEKDGIKLSSWDNSYLFIEGLYNKGAKEIHTVFLILEAIWFVVFFGMIYISNMKDDINLFPAIISMLLVLMLILVFASKTNMSKAMKRRRECRAFYDMIIDIEHNYLMAAGKTVYTVRYVWKPDHFFKLSDVFWVYEKNKKMVFVMNSGKKISAPKPERTDIIYNAVRINNPYAYVGENGRGKALPSATLTDNTIRKYKTMKTFN